MPLYSNLFWICNFGFKKIQRFKSVKFYFFPYLKV